MVAHMFFAAVVIGALRVNINLYVNLYISTYIY